MNAKRKFLIDHAPNGARYFIDGRLVESGLFYTALEKDYPKLRRLDRQIETTKQRLKDLLIKRDCLWAQAKEGGK